MRLPAVLAALALPLALALAAPAAAQTPPAAIGLSPDAVAAWVRDKGGEVSETQRDGNETWLVVNDGQFTWLIFFYSCQGDVCADIQYAASFSTPTMTADLMNRWNRERRFLKAYFEPSDGGSGVVQYDVLLHAGDAEQLAEPTIVWLNLLGEFAAFAGATPAAPAAQ